MREIWPGALGASEAMQSQLPVCGKQSACGLTMKILADQWSVPD
jgi:hypothetical protein